MLPGKTIHSWAQREFRWERPLNDNVAINITLSTIHFLPFTSSTSKMSPAQEPRTQTSMVVPMMVINAKTPQTAFMQQSVVIR